MHLHEKLTRVGFSLRYDDLLTPAPVAAAYVKKTGLRPHLLTHPGVLLLEVNLQQCRHREGL